MEDTLQVQAGYGGLFLCSLRCNRLTLSTGTRQRGGFFTAVPVEAQSGTWHGEVHTHMETMTKMGSWCTFTAHNLEDV